jgi:hypothetical protein
VSTEITGYTASALAWLFSVTKEEVYLDRARKTARFLIDCAWDVKRQTFPFEHPSSFTYFFDCGIIVRGLLAVWHQTKEDQLLDVAHRAARSMVNDFGAGADCHPILNLPDKTPIDRTSHWSRGPGCYQLKSALAWFDVAEITGDADLRAAWEISLASSLASHESFLPAATGTDVMDRLHAYSYFLEALTAVLDRPECQTAYGKALSGVEQNLGALRSTFVRSDVYAQLLRACLNGQQVVPLDVPSASAEAEALASFQAESEDPRIDGGFWFGRRDGKLSPHVNPVSTAFAMQALHMWQGGSRPCRHLLI